MTERGTSVRTWAAARQDERLIRSVKHCTSKSCARSFPRDIGKDRPCLNLHLGRCCAPCTGKVSPEEYHALIEQAISLFEGDAKSSSVNSPRR